MRTPLRVLAVIAASAAVPSAAQADISYIDHHNVWLTSPNGAVTVPVTTDGAEDAPYRYQAQAAGSGRIVAARGGGNSWTVTRFGGPLLAQEGTEALPYRADGNLHVFPISLAISADGAVISYGHSSCTFACQSVSTGSWLAVLGLGTLSTNPQGVSADLTTFHGNRLVGERGGEIDIQPADPDAPFTSSWQPWLSSDTLMLEQAAVGPRQVAVVHDGGGTTDGLLVGAHDGNIPGGTVGPFCDMPVAADPIHPSFSPDGAWIAWRDAGGVKVAGAPNLAAGTAACQLTSPVRVITPTGTHPSFGASSAAAVQAARTPLPPGGDGGPVPGGPGTGVPGTDGPGTGGPGTGDGSAGGESDSGGADTGKKRALALTVAKKVTRSAFRKGIRLKVPAPKAGRISAKATVTAATARRIGLRVAKKKKGAKKAPDVTVATRTVNPKKAGPVTFRLKPTKAARRVASKMRNVTLSVTVTQAGSSAGRAKVKLR